MSAVNSRSSVLTPPKIPKKLLNDASSVIDDSLKGLAMVNKGLVLLENQRVIMRRDHQEMKGTIKLISGGGSGHEPAYAGFVGPGMLTAAVVGNIFTPPPTFIILNAIREIGVGYLPGVLLLINNYTGDRLNFGIAMERAINEGVYIKMLIVGEDCSLPQIGKFEGRRGMAGMIFIQKLAGAMAESGLSLEETFTRCHSIVMNDMATISIGLSPSVIPDSTQGILGLKDDELELGLGINGEPGVHRIPMGTAAEVIHNMIEHMFNPVSETHIESEPEHSIAVLINNMGGSSKLEENVFVMETVQQLAAKGYNVERIVSGSLLTSLETQGFSITVIKVTSPDIIKFLDAPTTAAAWPRVTNYVVPDDETVAITELPLFIPGSYRDLTDEQKAQLLQVGPKITEKSGESIMQILIFISDALIACENQLNAYDLEGGDGDLGTTMRKGCEAIKTAVENNRFYPNRPFAILQILSLITECTMGGISGALYSIFFAAAAKPFYSLEEEFPVDAIIWADCLREGTKAVMCYGRAEPGDRTMVDPLQAAVKASTEYLMKHPSRGKDALSIATAAVKNASRETKYMTPQMASSPTIYQKYLEQPDAGAHAVCLWFQALNEGVKILF